MTASELAQALRSSSLTGGVGGGSGSMALSRQQQARRTWSLDDFSTLNAVTSPMWLFSCATQKILWANRGAVSYFSRPLEAILAHRFSKSSGDESSGSAALTARVREEVEIGGGELSLSGDGPLPGIIPHPDSHLHEFLYQQVVLSQPNMDTTLCTLIQLKGGGLSGKLSAGQGALHSAGGPNSRTSIVKLMHRNSKDVHGPNSHSQDGKARSASLSMPALLDLVESILAGKPVSRDLVEALHQMLIRGELITQGSRIREELLEKEELDQDVGLNLLQLLGNSTLPAPMELFELPSTDLDGPQPSPPSAFRRNLGPSLTLSGSTNNLSGLAPGGGGGAGGAGGAAAARAETVAAALLDSVQLSSGSHSALVSPGGAAGLGALAAAAAAAAGEDDEQGHPFSTLFDAMESVLNTVDDWRFDAFRLAEATAGHPMSALGFWLVKRAGLMDALQLDGQALARFLRKIESSYPDNPYHNKTHAADVLQSMHVLMTRGGLLRRIGDDTPLLMLAGYLAAIVHDNEHRGLNNDFLVRMSDDLALTYNDSSPMENYHVAAAFRVMRSHGFNFLKKLSRERLVRLRRLLIEMVLATDMKQHFNTLSKFQAKLQVKLRSSGYQSGNHAAHLGGLQHLSEHPLGGSGRRSEAASALAAGEDNGCGPLVEDEADRSLVMQVALKCADVGHLAAPWEVHHRWVSGLEEEFFRQGDKEKAAHLMVSPLMDRCKDGITKSQVGFFDIVALPLFYSWAAVFQDATPLVRAVEDNCNRWRLLEAGRNTHTGAAGGGGGGGGAGASSAGSGSHNSK